MSDIDILRMAMKHSGLLEIAIDDKDMQRYLKRWNPIDDDFDAFKLMIDLDIQIHQKKDKVMAVFCGKWIQEPVGKCRYAATRRVITIAAAEKSNVKRNDL